MIDPEEYSTTGRPADAPRARRLGRWWWAVIVAALLVWWLRRETVVLVLLWCHAAAGWFLPVVVGAIALALSRRAKASPYRNPWLIAVVLLLALNLWLSRPIAKPSTPPDETFALEKLAGKNNREGRAWLRGPVPPSISGGLGSLGDFASPAGARLLVTALYGMGARRVTIIDVQEDQYLSDSDQLIVELPDAPFLRRHLFTFEAFAAATSGYGPMPDRGQRYLFLWWD